MSIAARQIVYDFFNLPYVTRIRIALDLGLCLREDCNLPEGQLWSLMFANLCEQDSLLQFQKRIAAQIAKEKLKEKTG